MLCILPSLRKTLGEIQLRGHGSLRLRHLLVSAARTEAAEVASIQRLLAHLFRRIPSPPAVVAEVSVRWLLTPTETGRESTHKQESEFDWP